MTFGKNYSDGNDGSSTSTAGLRWDFSANISVNLEYTYTKLDGKLDPTSPRQPNGQFAYSPHDFNLGFNPVTGPSFDWFRYGEDHENIVSFGVSFVF